MLLRLLYTEHITWAQHFVELFPFEWFSLQHFYKYVRVFLSKICSPPLNSSSSRKMLYHIYLSVPYFDYDIRWTKKWNPKLYKKLLSPNWFEIGIENSYPIGSLCRQKDSMPASICSNVIYIYTCGPFNMSVTLVEHTCNSSLENMGVSGQIGLPVSNRP